MKKMNILFIVACIFLSGCAASLPKNADEAMQNVSGWELNGTIAIGSFYYHPGLELIDAQGKPQMRDVLVDVKDKYFLMAIEDSTQNITYHVVLIIHNDEDAAFESIKVINQKNQEELPIHRNIREKSKPEVRINITLNRELLEEAAKDSIEILVQSQTELTANGRRLIFFRGFDVEGFLKGVDSILNAR